MTLTNDDAFDGGDLAAETADGGGLSLREAIAFANAMAGVDTITFASGAGEAFENDALIRLTAGELVATEALNIDGSTAGGAVVITGDADGDDITLAGTDITDVAASGAGLLDDNSRVLNITAFTGTSTLTGLTITGGRTTVDGIYSGYYFPNDSQSGGGIRSVGDTTLSNITVSGNSTTGDYATGGGIFSAGAATLTNSTVSGNSTAGDYARGGGIASDGGTTLTNSTVSGNSTAGSSADGGGIAVFDQLTISNSIVLGNTTSFADLGFDEIFEATFGGGDGTPEFLGGNIVGADSSAFDISGFSNVVNADPAQVFAATAGNSADGTVLAGVLADNGGPVQTIAILQGGLADDSGDNNFVPTSLLTDARGGVRISGGTVDLGALELNSGDATPDDDNLLGTFVADQIVALAGNDTIIGFGGDDVLSGDAGFDVLQGGTGNDTLNGGAQGDELNGGDGADSLIGVQGNDVLNGDAGNDTLNGGANEDQLFGGTGRDILNGQFGNDFLEGGIGLDRLFGGVGNDTLNGGDQADFLAGSDGIDILNGEAGNDRLFGGRDDDVLDGGADNDLVVGQFGRDTLFGSQGNDTLNGFSGFDVLNGGTGDDILDGGFNADIFVFEDDFGNDTILDFEQASNFERIDLSLLSTQLTFGDLVIADDNGDAVITIGTNTITLNGVDASALNAGDFIF